MFGTTCETLGVKHIMASVRRPTTCGKIERWHRSIQDELCSRCDRDVETIEEELPSYLEFYNVERAHHSLELRAPMTAYLADLMSAEGIAQGTNVHEVSG